MTDLYIGIAIMLALSAGLFVLGLRIGRRVSRRWSTLWILLTVAFLVGFGLLLLDSIHIARLLPFSNAIILGNWLPLGAGLLGGLAWARIEGRAWQRIVLVVPLLALGLYRSYGGLPGEPPLLRDHWKGEVCRQSSTSSCSAAAAATLLRACGIPATEIEMADLCLTREQGTPTLGLYRGLTLKTANTPWRVRAFHTDLPGLRAMTGPVILTVRLETGAKVDPRYSKDWGWAPGVNHTIVLYRFLPGDLIDVGDPNVGREQWSVESLKVLWHGDGMVVRKPQ